MLSLSPHGVRPSDERLRRSTDVPVEQESVEVLLAQHKALLQYERLVHLECWNEISATYPEGPPECSCSVCRQLEELSDRLVALAGNVRHYEEKLRIANQDLDEALTQRINIIPSQRHLDTGD